MAEEERAAEDDSWLINIIAMEGFSAGAVGSQDSSNYSREGGACLRMYELFAGGGATQMPTRVFRNYKEFKVRLFRISRVPVEPR